MLDALVTPLSFIFVLGILIFIHELGHFLLAKKVGIRVEKFSLGFPPNIISRQIGETQYCIGLIPLGGYVKMTGENPDEVNTGAPTEFMSKSVGQRAAVIFAGPFMNYVLAVVLSVGILYFNGRPIYDETRVVVTEVTADGPASKAGIQEGDEILAVDNTPVTKFESVSSKIHTKIEEPVEMTLLRKTDTIAVRMTTYKSTQPNLDGGVDTVGLVGVGLSQKITGYKDFSLWEATAGGFAATHLIVWETVKFIKMLVTGETSAKMIGGPVFIARESGRQARRGVSNLFFFMALLSINLAVLNVLPIPILDGGHLLFLAVEKIKGSPVSTKGRMVAQQVGLVLLLVLILMVTYNDIIRAVRGL